METHNLKIKNLFQTKLNFKDYLSQAYYIDKGINSKLEQIQSLRSLAEKASATLSDVQPSETRNFCRMEMIIAKIIDMENDLSRDIEKLIDLKHEIIRLINQIENSELKTILELRYLCFRNWEQIAIDLNYSLQHVFRLHDKALNLLNLKVESK